MKNNLREQFEAIDEDGSGEIDQDELSNAMEALGYKIAREELMNFFVDEDAEEEGTLKDGIDIDGFVKSHFLESGEVEKVHAERKNLGMTYIYILRKIEKEEKNENDDLE